MQSGVFVDLTFLEQWLQCDNVESIVHRKEKLVLANYAQMQYVVILSYGRQNAHLKTLIFLHFTM